MPTLAAGRPLEEVARVLHAAAALGPSAWGRGRCEGDMAQETEDTLRRNLIELFRTLDERQIPYVLVGGIAMLTYVDGRNTEDVDLLLAVESLARLPELAVTDQSQHFASGRFGGLTCSSQPTRSSKSPRAPIPQPTIFWSATCGA